MRLLIGCTDAADHVGPWELKGDIPDTPLLPGIYEAEFEIIHDGCDPSLHDIFDKVEGWPPPVVFVPYNYNAVGYSQLYIPLFGWRDGEFNILTARTNNNFMPYSNDLGYEEWPSLISFNHIECSPEFLYSNPHFIHAQVIISAPNTMEVFITTSWGDIEECVSEQSRASFNTIPHANCSESYKTTYRLVEACTLPCEPPLLGIESGTINGYRYSRYEAPFPSCQCD